MHSQSPHMVGIDIQDEPIRDFILRTFTENGAPSKHVLVKMIQLVIDDHAADGNSSVESRSRAKADQERFYLRIMNMQ